VFAARTGILVDPQIDRNIERAVTDFAEAFQGFQLPRRSSSGILGEIVIVRISSATANPARAEFPGAADQRDVVVGKVARNFSSAGKPIRKSPRGRASAPKPPGR